MADDRSAFNKDLRGASKQAQKRSRWGGLGRGLLALAGGALAGPLGAGIGSFLGSRAGSGLAGGHKEIQDRRFFNDEIDKAQNTFDDMKSGELGSQLARGARDAFTAYLNPKMFEAFKPSALQAKFSSAGTLPEVTVPEIEKVVGGPAISQNNRLSLDGVSDSFKPSMSMEEISKQLNVNPKLGEVANTAPLSGDHIVSKVNKDIGAPLPANKFSDSFASGGGDPSDGYQRAMAYANSPASARGQEMINGGFSGDSETFWSGPHQQSRLPSIQEAQGFINRGGTFPSADAFQGPVKAFTGSGSQNRLLAQALGFDPNGSIIDQLKRAGSGYSFDDRAKMFADLQRTGGL